MTEKDLEDKFRAGLFTIAMILTLIASIYFFISMHAVINTWFEYEYASIFSAAFGFAVIVVCIWLTRFYIISRR